MVRRSVTLLAFAAAVCADAAVDLRPQPHTFELEGVKIADIAFKNGEGLVTYSPPSGWRLAGSETELQLSPSTAQAEARISRAPKMEGGFTPEAVKQLKQEVLAKLPEGAAAVEWAEDRVSPMQICGQPTYEVELSYSAFGKRFTTSVLVCNFADEQLRFRIVAPTADFPGLYEPFRQSLYTLAGF